MQKYNIILYNMRQLDGEKEEEWRQLSLIIYFPHNGRRQHNRNQTKDKLQLDYTRYMKNSNHNKVSDLFDFGLSVTLLVLVHSCSQIILDIEISHLGFLALAETC
jgi:hypothetical protein